MVEIPPTIYTSCESLVSLKINRAWLPKPPESVSLPCLKTMDLRQIEFVDNLGVEMLISACPVLETLTMDNMYGVKVSQMKITIQVVMQTPKLKYLKLKRHRIERIIINELNDLSSIVTLNLYDLTNFGESFPNFLTLISCVRNLTISVDILQVNYLSFFILSNLRFFFFLSIEYEKL